MRFDGTIRQISPVVDADTGTVKITVEAPKYPELARPGAFVHVTLERTRHDDALTLPRDAFGADMADARVFVVDNEEVARAKTVETGLVVDGHVEILSGLDPQDRVVTAGRTRIDDGTKVEIHDPRATTEDKPESDEASE